jgi:hypothetical protein
MIAAGACLLGPGAALAAAGGPGDGEILVSGWLPVGSGPLDALDVMSITIDLPAQGESVLGFEIQFDYDEPVADGSWASDAQVIVLPPGGGSYTVGGLSHLPQADVLWSFDGPASDGPGRYGSDGEDVFMVWEDTPLPGGPYHVSLSNDWANDQNPNSYVDVSIRFYLTDPLFCHADIDGTRDVAFPDLLRVLLAWGVCVGCPEDLTGDDVVGFVDLVSLLGDWGPCP